MDKFAREFEDINGIPYVVDEVDDSHIPIVAHNLHAAYYYNRKGFHSILLHPYRRNSPKLWTSSLRSMRQVIVFFAACYHYGCCSYYCCSYRYVGSLSF